jgi:DNA-binding NtrC family response regulator
VARAIHQNSLIADGPFVAQNCSAVPRSLFESEFFGHEKGAFTGADKASLGLIRRAHGGTLFLDEIGDLPLDLQSKLLRVLETSEVRPVGGQKDHKVNVRVICATHRDLAQLVADKAFREDLYYRLNVVRVDVPPLRNRVDDIPVLMEHFLKLRCGDDIPVVAKGVMKALLSFPWPGNVRQLENEVTRAALLSDGEITTRDLSPELFLIRRTPSKQSGETPDLDFETGTLKERVDRLEAYVLEAELKGQGGNKSRVAKRLGLSRAGLNMKLKRLDLWADEKDASI